MRIHTVAPLVVILILGASMASSVSLLKHLASPYLINGTPSEPQGIYRLVARHSEDYRRGMFVVFPVPKNYRELVYGRGWLRAGVPLLKEILAVAGDRVCISGEALRINEHLIGPVFDRDSAGLTLPQHPGCFDVPNGYIFPGSTHLASSFDGRYFGAIQIADLSGEAVPVWTF